MAHKVLALSDYIKDAVTELGNYAVDLERFKYKTFQDAFEDWADKALRYQSPQEVRLIIRSMLRAKEMALVEKYVNWKHQFDIKEALNQLL